MEMIMKAVTRAELRNAFAGTLIPEPERIFLRSLPSSEARHTFASVLKSASLSEMPILITERDSPRSVVVSINQFAALIEDRQMLRRAIEALQEDIEGKTVSLREVLGRLERDERTTRGA
jgi:PHD/YefM family antitoxin component YafN of YafNO toxin-antitoxin module